MGLYEKIRTIARTKGYSINKLEQELGFARSSINKFNKNIPSVEKVQKIADFLDTPIEAILGKTGDKLSQSANSGTNVPTNNPADGLTSSIAESDMRPFLDANPYELKYDLDHILYKLYDETIVYDGHPLRQEAVTLFLYDLQAAIARLHIVNNVNDFKEKKTI